MHDDVLIWVMLVLSCPFALYAITPALRIVYRLIGRRYRCCVQEVGIRKASLTAENQRAIYEVSVHLRTDAGSNVNYMYRVIARDTPVVAVRGNDELQLFAVPWLATHAGWRPQTAYVEGGGLIDSMAIYGVFLVFGGLPFVAAVYHLTSGRNLLFDVIGLL